MTNVLRNYSSRDVLHQHVDDSLINLSAQRVRREAEFPLQAHPKHVSKMYPFVRFWTFPRLVWSCKWSCLNRCRNNVSYRSLYKSRSVFILSNHILFPGRNSIYRSGNFYLEKCQILVYFNIWKLIYIYINFCTYFDDKSKIGLIHVYHYIENFNWNTWWNI